MKAEMGRWRQMLLLVWLATVLVAGLCVQQSEALDSKNAVDTKELRHEADHDLSFLDDNDEEEEEEKVSETKEEFKDESEEDDDEDDDEDGEEEEEEEDNEGEDFEGDSTINEGLMEEEEEEEEIKEADEKDVVVLGGGNFTQVIESNHFVLVEFYAPWCGHCQALAPEYAEAATILKGKALVAKIDATLEDELAQKFEIESYPTLIFFIDGVQKSCNVQRRRDDIVAWVKKKTGPSVINIIAKEDAELVVETQKSTMVIAYLDDLQGSDTEEYSAAARQDDDVVFYQTDNVEVAQVFNFAKDANRPSLVLLKQEAEKVSWFDGNFKRDELVSFVAENKLPLVIRFNKESAPLIFESPIKRQFLLFADQDDLARVLPDFKIVSKAFAGKMVFVHVDLGDTEQAPGITEFFGIPSDKAAVMGFESQENGRKFFMEGEINVENMKAFAEGFLNDKLQAHLKSDPIPETNDGPVKVVVGKSLDDVVLDESTDCFLEIYAPWCGHCQALEPMWTKLARRLQSVKSLVIAKMDGTTNEHVRAKSDGYPTLLFYPAGKKSFDPITYDGDRTLKDFVKFLKREVSIPFAVPKRPTMITEETPIGAAEAVTTSTEVVEPESTSAEAVEPETSTSKVVEPVSFKEDENPTNEPEEGTEESSISDSPSTVVEPESTQQPMCESKCTKRPETQETSVDEADSSSTIDEAESSEESESEANSGSMKDKIQSVVKDTSESVKDEL